jgi:hypothetical protein
MSWLMIWKNKKIENIYVGCKMLVKKGDYMPNANWKYGRNCEIIFEIQISNMKWIMMCLNKHE